MKPRRKHQNSRRAAKSRACSAHLAWLRGHVCCACGSPDRIEAAHVRRETDGGTGLRPDDMWTIPLCNGCHALQHLVGEISFEARTGISMKAEAGKYAARSPHLQKLEREEA